MGTRIAAYTGAPLLGSQNALVPTDRSGAVTLPRDPAFYRLDIRFENKGAGGLGKMFKQAMTGEVDLELAVDRRPEAH